MLFNSSFSRKQRLHSGSLGNPTLHSYCYLCVSGSPGDCSCAPPLEQRGAIGPVGDQGSPGSPGAPGAPGPRGDSGLSGDTGQPGQQVCHQFSSID